MLYNSYMYRGTQKDSSDINVRLWFSSTHSLWSNPLIFTEPDPTKLHNRFRERFLVYEVFCITSQFTVSLKCLHSLRLDGSIFFT